MSKTPFLDVIDKGVKFTPVDEVSSYDLEYWNGRLLVWEECRKEASYVIGFDPAEGSGMDQCYRSPTTG